jgi:hypothetical protein
MFRSKGIFEGIEIFTDSNSGVEMPVRYYRAEMIASLFEADLESLLPLMPHPRMHPVRRGNHKSAISIIQTVCNHGSLPPYRSVAIAVPVTIGKWPAPSYLPLLFEESWPNKGLFIYKEAVNTGDSFSAMTEVWGYPTMLTEVNHDMVDDNYLETTVTEEEKILTIRIRRPGYVREERKDLMLYSVKQGYVCENIVRTESSEDFSRRPDSSVIVFGKHPLGQQLKAMGVGPYCLATRSMLDLKSVRLSPRYLE